MSAANPTFFLGDDYESGGHTFPMSDVTAGTLKMGPVSVREDARYRRLAQLQNTAGTFLDDENVQKITRLSFSLSMADGQRMGDLVAAAKELRDSIGYTARHLWLVDDGAPAASEGLVTNGGIKGPGAETLGYSPDATGWLSDNDFLLIPIATGETGPHPSGAEVAVVSNVTSVDFDVTLAQTHAGALTCFKVFAVYPNAVCERITMSEAPLGKGSLDLEWICPEEIVIGTTLPADTP